MKNITALFMVLLLSTASLAMGTAPSMTAPSVSTVKQEVVKAASSIASGSVSKSFKASADTWVYAFRPDKNYGDGLGWKDITNPGEPYSVPRIFIGFGGTDIKIGLIKFDLSGIDNSRPVKSATMQLYNCFAGSDAGVNVDIKMIASSWDESTVTYKNKPSTGDTLSTVLLKGGRNYNDSGKWYSFDVTKAVQAWQGGAANNGLMIYPQGEYGVDFEFVCKESAGGAERGPKLEIAY